MNHCTYTKDTDTLPCNNVGVSKCPPSGPLKRNVFSSGLLMGQLDYSSSDLQQPACLDSFGLEQIPYFLAPLW